MLNLAKRVRLWIAVLIAIGSTAGTAVAAEVIIVLDGSGSSAGQIGGIAKIDIARGALRSFLAGAPDDLSIGLVAYGHRQQENCSDFELLTSPGTTDVFLAAADNVRSVGRSPIGAATAAAAAALSDPDTATIIVITDNADNCSPNPCETISDIHDEMPGLTISVAGIAIPADEVSEISCFAAITGGLYLRADNAADFRLNLDEIMSAALVDPLPPLPTATISLPVAVVQGQVFSVQYRGPTAIGDQIRIAWLGSPAQQYISGAFVGVNGEPIALTAPTEVGTFELRYWHADRGMILASMPLRVAALAPTIEARSEVQQGGDIIVGWRASDAADVTILLVDPRSPAGEAIAAIPVIRREPTATLPAPAATGTYEILLVDAGRPLNRPIDLRIIAHAVVLARATIDVVAAEVRMTVPDTVLAGAEFNVAWAGPGGREDEIRLASVGMPKSDALATAAPNSQTISFRAPFPAGSYELRYYSKVLDEVIAIERIQIEMPTASLGAIEVVEGGAPFEVVWTGPGAVGDRVAIVQTTSDVNEILTAQRLPLFGRSIVFDAPVTAGNYGLVYLSGEGTVVLTRIQITTTRPEVELTALNTAIPGEAILVDWEGPGGRSDEIRLLGPGLNSPIFSATRLVPGTPAVLTAPGSGRYRIVYWTGAWESELLSVEIDVGCAGCDATTLIPDADLRLGP